MDHHALAVDIGHLQANDLGAAHARAVEHHQQRARKQATACLNQTRHFFTAQDVGQLAAHPGVGQKVAKLGPVQCAQVKEPQRRDVVLDGSRTEFSFLEQVDLVAAQVIGAKLVRALAEVLRESLHKA